MDWLSIREFIIDFVKLIIVIVVILFLMIYVVSITQVVGNSMHSTLENGEVLILNKFKYRFMDIERGDIISLQYADTKYLIKRVIGLPGDSVSIRDNTLYINGELYVESYLDEGLVYDDFELSSLGYDTIPDDMYLVLGDNREDSLDSREIGLIRRDELAILLNYVNNDEFYQLVRDLNSKNIFVRISALNRFETVGQRSNISLEEIQSFLYFLHDNPTLVSDVVPFLTKISTDVWDKSYYFYTSLLAFRDVFMELEMKKSAINRTLKK